MGSLHFTEIIHVYEVMPLSMQIIRLSIMLRWGYFNINVDSFVSARDEGKDKGGTSRQTKQPREY